MKNQREETKLGFPGVELVEKAIRICCEAHKGQLRKGDGKPYFIHPIMAALKLARYGVSDETIAAALTHDVIEDTDYPREILREELGNRVFEMIEALTQNDKLSYREKKLEYIESVRNAGTDVKLISVADKVHNLESLIMAHRKKGKDIWELFSGSKENKTWFETNLLEVLKDINHPLIDEYKSLIETERELE